MMSDFLLIALLVIIATYFWQLRNMAELCKIVAEKACKKQNVQLLSTAMESARPWLGGNSGLSWKATYIFEFSTNGINQFQGSIKMMGNKVTKIDWPIFPEPEWFEAPKSQGRFGSCGGKSSCGSKACH